MQIISLGYAYNEINCENGKLTLEYNTIIWQLYDDERISFKRLLTIKVFLVFYVLYFFIQCHTLTLKCDVITFIYWWLEISNIKPTLKYYLLFSFSLSTRMSNKPFVICWSTKMTNIYFIISLFGIFNSYHVSSSAIDWNYEKEILKGNIDELKNVNALNAFASRPNGGNDDPTVCNLWFIMSTIYWKIP